MVELIQQQTTLFIAVVCIAFMVLITASVLVVYLCRSRAQARRFTYEREFYRSWESSSDEVLVLYDAVTKIPVYVAGNAIEVLGLSIEALYRDPHSLDYCLTDEGRSEFRDLVDSSDPTSLLRHETAYHRVGEDAVRFALITLRSSRTHAYRVLLFRDITQEKEIRDRLATEAAEARTSEQEKSDFLSSMSHEIRTPMNGIMGMLSLAKMGVKESPEVLGYLDQAEDLSTYLLSLINDILDMSKIESGKMELEWHPFDITDILLSVDEIFRGMMEEKGISFTVDADEITGKYVLGDDLRVTQILTNLLSNAYKFTDTGGEIRCLLRQMQVTEDTSHLLFEVSDTGKGMEPAFLDNIFNPFVQEDTSISRKFGGTGLGMSITDNLVRLMGGQITVESKVGEGSTFRVYLSMLLAVGDQIGAAAAYHEQHIEGRVAAKEPFKLEGCNVLMAEDNRVNAMIAEKMLLELGATVDVAGNGQQAVDMFKASHCGQYGLILMDIQMPIMDGRQATRAIRSLDRPDAATTPILALSANAYVEDVRESKEAGMNGHLTKPVDFSILEQTVARELMS